MAKLGKSVLNVLVFGAGGMLGSVIIHTLYKNAHINVHGTIRSSSVPLEIDSLKSSLITSINVLSHNSIERLLDVYNPHVVINAAVVRQEPVSTDQAYQMMQINSEWPLSLAIMAKERGIRLVHISTDGVFSGKRGAYTENDKPDPSSLYTLSKYLGEPRGENSIVLRTSIIGSAPSSDDGLVDWVLRQTGAVNGYRQSVFSGLTALELSNLIENYVLPNDKLAGIFHLASEPISKFELLIKIAKHYALNVTVQPSDDVVIDRSLVGQKFQLATGYISPSWDQMIEEMQNFDLKK